MSRYINPVPQYYLNDGSVASSGKLYFYENKDPNTKKDTFSDEAETIKNTNPVILDGEGRCPPIFGTGRYTVVLKSSQNIQQWSRDDVDLTSVLGQFADWSAIITYRVNDIVRGSDGNYYSSIASNNLGNDPVSSPTLWEELAFLTFWNPNVVYSEDEIILYAGNIYSSRIDDNVNNQPDVSLSEWSNLTSINSVSQTVELGGDFGSGEEVTCTRVGDIVTISSEGALISNTATPSSDPGVIPPEFRPSGERRTLYGMTSSRVVMMEVDQNGDVNLRFQDWTGVLDAFGSTVYPLLITYSVPA